MSTRRTLLLIALVAVLLLAAVAVWRLVATRNRAGDTLTDIAATPQPPPTAEATATADTAGRPAPTTPAPTPDIVQRPGGDDTPGGLDLAAPPALAELLERYPELAALRENVDLSDPEQLRRVFDTLVMLYSAEGLAALDAVMAETGTLQSLNLDPAYLDFALAYETGGLAAAEALARQRRLLTDDNQLRAVLVLDTDDLSLVEPALTAAGVTVLLHAGNEVEIGIPLAQIEAAATSADALAQLVALAYLPHVVTVRVPEASPVEALPPADEGATLTQAAAWHAAGYTGQGVKVGIIDPDGFFGYQALLGSQLPPADRVFTPPWIDPAELNADTGPHGAACAEIVYDMAPGATLYLAYTGTTPTGLSRAVDWLIANDVDIITHSASSLVEPLDGTGESDDEVARAQAAGILWVNASGNYALSHLDMVFTDADGDGYHEFPHGDELLPIYTAPTASVGLSWDEAWERSSEDYDLYVYTLDRDGQPEIVASSRMLQGGRAADLPYELIDMELSSRADYYVAIQEDGISRAGRLNLIGWGMEFDYSMPEGSLGSPADAFGALAVGATDWRTDVLENYSSQGPTADGRTKPDLSAPVRVSTVTYGLFDGTSAAAPHVAGAAALVLGAQPDLDDRQLRDFLTGRALDLGTLGPDNGFGVGRLDLQQPPTAPARVVGPAAATVHAVRLAHNQVVEGVSGVMIYTDFSVSGLRDLAGTVVARFSDAAGQPLRDGNGQYVDAAGGVAVSDTFQATQPDATATEYPLFMPYDELELPPGEHNLLVTVTVGDAAGNPLATAAPVALIVEKADDAAPTAAIGQIDIIHNVERDGMTGMDIVIDFDALGLAGQPATLAAYFYFNDANDTPLLDFNHAYRTQDGIVAVGRGFTPGSDRAEFRDFALFMPYGELHMAEGARYELKLHVVIWDETTGVTLGVSEWAPFWFET